MCGPGSTESWTEQIRVMVCQRPVSGQHQSCSIVLVLHHRDLTLHCPSVVWSHGEQQQGSSRSVDHCSPVNFIHFKGSVTSFSAPLLHYIFTWQIVVCCCINVLNLRNDTQPFKWELVLSWVNEIHQQSTDIQIYVAHEKPQLVFSQLFPKN